MHVGLQIPDFTYPGGASRMGADLATVARTADDAGFGFISVMDHFWQIGVVGPPERDMLEAYTTLGYVAACTSRAKLVTLVTGTVYRHPGVLAKIISTLDVLSGGRGAVRAAGADPADLPADVARRRDPVRGAALPARPAAEPAAAADPAAPADHDRRRRGA